MSSDLSAGETDRPDIAEELGELIAEEDAKAEKERRLLLAN